MKPTTFNQPIFFGANSISIQFLAIAGGGLPATGRDAHLDLAVEFTEGKVHEIWKTLEQTRQKAEMVKADAAWQKDQLRECQRYACLDKHFDEDGLMSFLVARYEPRQF